MDKGILAHWPRCLGKPFKAQLKLHRQPLLLCSTRCCRRSNRQRLHYLCTHRRLRRLHTSHQLWRRNHLCRHSRSSHRMCWHSSWRRKHHRLHHQQLQLHMHLPLWGVCRRYQYPIHRWTRLQLFLLMWFSSFSSS